MNYESRSVIFLLLLHVMFLSGHGKDNTFSDESTLEVFGDKSFTDSEKKIHVYNKEMNTCFKTGIIINKTLTIQCSDYPISGFNMPPIFYNFSRVILMRVKLYFKGRPGIVFPFNYNHILMSIIYKLFDSQYSKEVHDHSHFKFFNFSQLEFNEYKVVNGGLMSVDGHVSFSVSSPDDDLVKHLLNGIVSANHVYFNDMYLRIVNIEFFMDPNFRGECNFKTLSPILVHTSLPIEGSLRVVDLAPDLTYFRIMKKNLISKYLSFNNLDSTDKDIEISLASDWVKPKRIVIKENTASETFNRAYFIDVHMEGDNDLIKFAWDTGLGHKNSLGFGMIDVI